MRIGIVIVSYNTRALLLNCLRSIFAFVEPEDEAIRVAVVDNGSTDGSMETVRREFPTVMGVEAGENLGFGRANNLGIKYLEERYGTAEYLFFLNPDTVLLNDAVGMLADFLDRNPTAGACGGNLYGADGKTPALSFSPVHGIGWELTTLLPNALKRRVWPESTWFNYGDRPRPVGYVSGADLMVRRKALGSATVFDPDFFMYYEDMELCVRIRRAGFEVRSVPQARIIHLAGQSCRVSRTKFERLLEAKYLYYTKIQGKRYALRAYLLLQAGYRLHALLGRIAGNRSKRNRYAEWAQINTEIWRRHLTTHENLCTPKKKN
ncbi:MAG: glycosyltransferase family 2 protein [Rikenella sp.]|nr:glycosyltransferase family 2 protein [Rikenella sp.]